jgi:uncharacterized protein YqgQ|tara:strand:+ start:402 stop:626 length:225 start_codon:yes stop_codon:yes gene_type:complete
LTTKKDFIAIAAILKNERRKTLSDQDFTGKVKNILITSIARQLSDMFGATNKLFDGEVFMDATNLTEDEKRLPL